MSKEQLEALEEANRIRNKAVENKESNQCPFAIYHYECDKQDCRKCTIMIENRTKANEDREISDNMRSFWIERADGAER